jgi:hypothetical protein
VTLCGRTLIGQGSDSYDPTCVLPKHHRGQPCIPGDDLRLWIAALATHWRWDSYILPEHNHSGYEIRNSHTVVVRHRKTVKSAVRMAKYVAVLHRGDRARARGAGK